MKTCELCGKEIPEDSAGCVYCKKIPEGDPGTLSQDGIFKKFRGFAVKDGKKFAGVFEAVDEEDARQRLVDQGFEFVKIEPVVPPEEKKDPPSVIRFRLFMKQCCSQPVMIIIPITLILLGVSLYQNTMVAIRNQAATSAEAARRATFPQMGDEIYLQPGYFITEDKRIFNTALTHQRSGNMVALQKLFSGQRGMMVSKEGMKVFYEGRDGVVPRAAKIKFADAQEILYIDHDAIDIKKSKEAAAQGTATGSSKKV